MAFHQPLPPIRELIKPDPGYILVDGDLDRADAQMVAWYAGEGELKQIFQAGHDIHTENAKWMYGHCKTQEHRQRMKNSIHAVHYGTRARTLAATSGVTVADAEKFLAYWFSRFPGIKRWHVAVGQQLAFKHCIHNVWGFRRFYFDRNTDALLPQALAWLGQSSVAVTINHAMLRIEKLDEDLTLRTLWAMAALEGSPGIKRSVELLLQVHDSLLMQVPTALCPRIFPAIKAAMEVKVPFDDPLVIPVSLKWSTLNWGKMEKWSAPGAALKEVA